jgi:hypothetical protein
MKLKVFLLVLFALALNVGVAAAQSDDMPELYTATVVPCPGDILAGAAFAGGTAPACRLHPIRWSTWPVVPAGPAVSMCRRTRCFTRT